MTNTVENKSLVERINTMPVRPWHWKLLFLCMTAVAISNFNGISLSMAMPIIVKSWQLQPYMIGVLLSATAIGQLIGAAVFGVLCDVIGRRKTFILTIAIFTVGVLISVFAQSFSQLYILRVIAGFGLGGYIPVGMATVSEFVPTKVRGRFIGIYSIGNGIGYVFAVITSMFVVRVMDDGWRIVFAVAAAVGVIIIPVLLLTLPESVAWLISKGKAEQAIKLVEKVETKALGQVTVSHEAAVKSAEQASAQGNRKKASIKDLFDKKMIAATILAMIMWFVSSYTFFGFIQWMPTFLTNNMGYSLTQGYWFTLISALVGTGTPGILVGYSSDYLGKRTTFIICMISYAVASLFFLWFGGLWLMPLYWFSSAMSSQLYIYTPALFPPAFKGSGLGFSSAVGRVAQSIAPMLIGLSVAAGGLAGVMYVNVALLVAAALAALALGVKDVGIKSQAGKAAEANASMHN